MRKLCCVVSYSMPREIGRSAQRRKVFIFQSFSLYSLIAFTLSVIRSFVAIVLVFL